MAPQAARIAMVRILLRKVVPPDRRVIHSNSDGCNLQAGCTGALSTALAVDLDSSGSLDQNENSLNRVPGDLLATSNSWSEAEPNDVRHTVSA